MMHFQKTLRGSLCFTALFVPQVAMADERIPNYDVRAMCRYAAQVAGSVESEQTCLQEEQASRAELEKKWATFPSGDRAHCAAESSAGGLPSYVDLQTCLEMTRDARDMERERESTTGQGQKKQ
jgi:hypothetical protein